jgi:transcriptional regulator with XRE-family HTH domain
MSDSTTACYRERIGRVAEVLRNRFPFLIAGDDMKDLARVVVALSQPSDDLASAPSEAVGRGEDARTYDRLVVEGVFENAVYSAFSNLLAIRKEEGLKKSDIADRMGVDRATVTELTTSPTNMKIMTAASLANALAADIVFLLIDRDQKRAFSAIGELHSIIPNADRDAIREALKEADCYIHQMVIPDKRGREIMGRITAALALLGEMR